METLQERLKSIVRTSYDLLCRKIVGGVIDVDNEASLQMQLGVIMKTLGQLYEFTPADRFTIVLEHVVKNDRLQTWKSKGKARIDIMLTLTNGKESCNAAIELKYFPKADGETITDNRFFMLADIENLETYICTGEVNLGYFMLYTTNKNYMSDARSSVKIGNEKPVNGVITSNNRKITLTGSYYMNWNTFEDDKHCFLLQPVKPICHEK